MMNAICKTKEASHVGVDVIVIYRIRFIVWQSNDGSSMCLELALEGERLCKSGDCRTGVAFFQVS